MSLEIENPRDRLAALKKERERLLGELRARSANANEMRNEMKQKQAAKVDQVRRQMDDTQLGMDLYKTYGNASLDKAVDYYDPPSGQTTEYKQKSSLLADVIEQRKLEKRMKSEQFRENVNLLNNHRRHLIHEQQRVREDKRRLIGGAMSPSMISIPGDHDIHRYPKPPYPIDTPSEPSRSPYEPYPDNRIETMETIVQRVKELIPRMERTVADLKNELDAEDLNFVQFNEGSEVFDKYEPHQKEAFVICRSIVNEMVEKSMDSFLRERLPPEARQFREEEHLAVTRQLNQHEKMNMHLRVFTLIRDELVLDVTSQMTLDVIDEYFETCKLASAKANNAIIRACEEVVSEEQQERLPDDRDYIKVNQRFAKLIQDRLESKERLSGKEQIWSHSLPLVHVSGSPVVEENKDIEPIEVDQIKPFSLRTDDQDSTIFRNFKTREGEYWQEIRPEFSQIPLTSSLRGCLCAKLGNKHRLLAVGTGRGDILVYDLFQTPPLALYAVANRSSPQFPIEAIAWSPDDTQLLCQRNQSMTLYSLQKSFTLRERELDLLGLEFKANSLFKPFHLHEIVTLNQMEADFVFQRGPIAEQRTDDKVYALGLFKFHPSCSLTGLTFSIVASLENGEVQKIDLEGRTMAKPNRTEQPQSLTKVVHSPIKKETRPNYIGQDTESEVFRGHKNPLMLIAFVSAVGDMITLDERGYLFWWRYSKNSFLDGFEPYKKNKLMLEKTVYVPTNSQTPPKVIFSPFRANSRGKRVAIPADELEILKEKVEMMLFLRSIEEKEIIWRDLNQLEKTISKRYPAHAISKSGSDFFTITRHLEDLELVKVVKETLRPSKVQAVRLMEAEVTPDGDVLVYMALFEASNSNEPHLSFFAYDLEEKKSLNVRLDIKLTKREFDFVIRGDVCSFETTRPFEATSTAYIIVNVLGVLQGYSLTTGTHLMTLSNEPFIGLNLSEYPNLPKTFLRLSPSANIVVASPPKLHRILIIVYGPKEKNVSIMSLHDYNSPETRKATWLAYRTLEMIQPQKIIKYDPDQRIKQNMWTLDGEEFIAAQTVCKTIVLDIVDAAVDIAFFERSRDQEPVPQFDQSGQQIVDDRGQPILVAPKRGYPEDYETQRKLQQDKNRQTALQSISNKNFYGDTTVYSSPEEMLVATKKAEKMRAKALKKQLQERSGQNGNDVTGAETTNGNNAADASEPPPPPSPLND